MNIEKISRNAEKSRSSRKPRSDGQRNRELILHIAKEAFTQNGAGASLDDIARQAGVGAVGPRAVGTTLESAGDTTRMTRILIR